MRVRPGLLVVSRESRALGPRAVDELLRGAEVLSEGRLEALTFFGSTLLSIDLGRVAGAPTDAAARALVVHLAEGSVRFRLRAMRMALAELHRRHPDIPFGTAHVETRVRLEGALLLVDVDLEVPVVVSSPFSQSS